MGSEFARELVYDTISTISTMIRSVRSRPSGPVHTRSNGAPLRNLSASWLHFISAQVHVRQRMDGPDRPTTEVTIGTRVRPV